VVPLTTPNTRRGERKLNTFTILSYLSNKIYHPNTFQIPRVRWAHPQSPEQRIWKIQQDIDGEERLNLSRLSLIDSIPRLDCN
jgi:hypothetical protein